MYNSIDNVDWNGHFALFCCKRLVIADFAVEDFHEYLINLLPSLPQDFNFRLAFLSYLYSDTTITDLQATTIEYGYDSAIDQYHSWLSSTEGVTSVRKDKIMRLLKTL